MNLWATGQTGRAVYRHMNRTRPNDNMRSLSRKEQVAIFRLRTQHVPLNHHLNRINPEHPPMCALCNAQFETSLHLLLYCPNLQDLRHLYLPPSPSINNTLYSTTDQMKRTSTFYFMALGRRAKTHRLLD